MLCLSRRKDESIRIGHDIEIIVIGICGEKVRLGVEALRNVSVHRKEVYDAIYQQPPMVNGIPAASLAREYRK